MSVQTVEQEVRILVYRRTAGTGHVVAEFGLEDAVKFADTEIAQGRLVVLEMGTESMVVRIGREIRDFVRRLMGKGQPVLTTLSPMAGGQDEMPGGGVAGIEAPPELPLPGRILNRYHGDAAVERGPARMPGQGGGSPMVSPEADVRAWQALIARIGDRAARAMLAGGGYAVRSKLWPYIVYVVTPETIKIINQGMQVSRVCIIATDGGSIWDAMLNRIQLLESGVDGEVQVFATGQLSMG